MADQLLSDRLDEVIDALRDPELAPLARVAADLRHYPRRDFTSRLRTQLERRTTMTTATLAPGIREGFTTVTPYVWVPDRGLADFLIRTFDAVETRVDENPGHGIHRELRIGSSMVMIGETGRTDVPARSQAFHVFVDDADATFARALAAGAMSLGEPEDRHYGERTGFVADAYGNQWFIATALGPQSLGHALRTVTPYLFADDVDGYMKFLTRAFGAVEETRAEQPGGVIPYARMRVGDAAVEFGTHTPMPGAYFLYVSDPDAVYEQALAAGATSLSAPADQPSGLRIGFVEDPLGNHWYIARPAGSTRA
jgi:PhnB protein